MTVREDIAQVRKLVNSVHLDGRISNQFIYNKIIDVTKLIMRREAENRRIYRSVELFRTLPDCIELESYEPRFCTNVFLPNCRNIMRSKYKIPKAYLSTTGSIVFVFNVDRSEQFFQTTPSSYADIQKREFRANKIYFWIQDDYIYIPDSYISEVVVDGIFIDNSQVYKTCKILDSDSSIIDGIRTDVIRVAAQEIVGLMKRIPEDESPELNSNKKN